MECLESHCEKCKKDNISYQPVHYFLCEVCVIITCLDCGHEHMSVVDRYCFEHREDYFGAIQEDNECDLSFRRLFDENLSTWERLKILAHHLELARKMMEKRFKDHLKSKAGMVYKWRRYEPFTELTPEEAKEKIQQYGDSVRG